MSLGNVSSSDPEATYRVNSGSGSGSGPSLVSKLNLLTLPNEIVTEIISNLIPPAALSAITVRWTFIRERSQTRYLPWTHLPRDTTTLLLICRSLTEMVLAMLYGLPFWRCDCRLETLWSQVGGCNFARVRRMSVSVADLSLLADAVEIDEISRSRREDRGHGVGLSTNGTCRSKDDGMLFSSLEELECDGCDAEVWWTVVDLAFSVDVVDVHVDGYHDTVAVRSMHMQLNSEDTARNATLKIKSRQRRHDASICTFAIRILRAHPKLNRLVQRVTLIPSSILEVTKKDGADAVNVGPGRVSWRFLADNVTTRDVEMVADISLLSPVIDELMRSNGDDEYGTTTDSTSLPVGGENNERVEQYAYLRNTT